ncbi:MAG: RelA/SpoT domain-containing protein [Acidimicrobiaceae bacterium]|nr:RelA/SpoT domain-containing protein [Acidimicrobiaceae bacterium]
MSNNQANKAAQLIRSSLLGELRLLLPNEHEEALSVVRAYRDDHKLALVTANNGLRSCLRTLGLEGEVTQRLKRVPTIVDKLRRQPTMKLSQMHDIGGCRVVLVSADEVEKVKARFARNSRSRNGKDDKIIDYVMSPRSSGYRAVHLRTFYRNRKVEVQLRTSGQHAWAVFVENLGEVSKHDLKSGEGPQSVLNWLRKLADGIAHEEAGMVLDETFGHELARLAKLAQKDLRRT